MMNGHDEEIAELKQRADDWTARAIRAEQIQVDQAVALQRAELDLRILRSQLKIAQRRLRQLQGRVTPGDTVRSRSARAAQEAEEERNSKRQQPKTRPQVLGP